MKHSKEPWAVRSRSRVNIADKSNRDVAQFWKAELGEEKAIANAKRAVDCVNLLSGIDIEKLKTFIEANKEKFK